MKWELSFCFQPLFIFFILFFLLLNIFPIWFCMFICNQTQKFDMAGHRLIKDARYTNKRTRFWMRLRHCVDLAQGDKNILRCWDILESLLYILASPVCYLLVIMTISCVDSNILHAGAPWQYLTSCSLCTPLNFRAGIDPWSRPWDHHWYLYIYNLKACMIEEWTFCSLGDKRWCLNSSILFSPMNMIEFINLLEKSNEIKQTVSLSWV